MLTWLKVRNFKQFESDYNLLAKLLPRDAIDAEISAKLDAVVEVAGRARPRR